MATTVVAGSTAWIRPTCRPDPSTGKCNEFGEETMDSEFACDGGEVLQYQFEERLSNGSYCCYHNNSSPAKMPKTRSTYRTQSISD